MIKSVIRFIFFSDNIRHTNNFKTLLLQVRQTIDEILDKIPDEFNIQDMAIRAEERTPYTTVVFQECERMNALMAEIKNSLIKLNLGLKVGRCFYLMIIWTKTDTSFSRENSLLHQKWKK